MSKENMAEGAQNPEVPVWRKAVNKVISGVNRAKIPVVTGLAMIGLAGGGTACAKTPTPEASPTPEGLGGTPALTFTPTESATATATNKPTETLAPTKEVTPTQDFKEFEGKDCTNWKEPCPATLEDLKSGLLLEYTKSIAEPFTSETHSIFSITPFDKSDITKTFVIKLAENMQYKDANKIFADPKKTPVRFVTHFFIEGDPHPDKSLHQNIYVDFQQFRNADGSSGFFQYFTPDNTPQQWRSYIFERMAYTVPIRPGFFKTPPVGLMPEGKDFFADAIYYHAERTNQELDQWAKTLTISKELEREFLQEFGAGPEDSQYYK